MGAVELDINPKFEYALKMIESGSKSLFITGNAGTGKSTLLRHFRGNTKKNLAVVAPTGVAAVNVEGETIHSLFGLSPNSNIDDIYKFPTSNPKRGLLEALEVLVIDEISMVRADLLDLVDKSLKVNRDSKEPFGGVKVVMFGDLLQLPPVVTELDKEVFEFMYKSPYFFDAFVMQDVDLEIIQLDKIYRQSDKTFVDLLNGLRKRENLGPVLKSLNERVLDFETSLDELEEYVYLATTNKIADEVNTRKLAGINSESALFDADIYGDFKRNFAPVPDQLELKRGARIMMQNNDKEDRWINGSLGIVEDIIKDDFSNDIIVKLDDGGRFVVSPHSWDMYKYEFDPAERKVVSNSVGSFTQLPVKLAWGVTIHKSQGKTFDKILVDLGWGAFAHGQVYVALSRCTSLDGILLKKPIRTNDVKVDQRVLEWLASL